MGAAPTRRVRRATEPGKEAQAADSRTLAEPVRELLPPDRLQP
ncbi:hypothetical protein [Streptomyces sp. NPDC058773]